MKIRTGFYAEQTYLDMIPSLLRQANCKSKNEFMNAALLFYISYLENHLIYDLIAIRAFLIA